MINSQSFNVSCNKAFKFLLELNRESKMILTDLEKLLLNKGFISALDRNSNGSNISKGFNADPKSWMTQYISRWYYIDDEQMSSFVLGTAVIFFDNSMSEEFAPVLVIGLFEKKDVEKSPRRINYDYWWLKSAWLEDGAPDKKTNELYSFDCKWGDDSYYWYKSVRIFAKELCSINSQNDIAEILDGIIDFKNTAKKIEAED